MRISTTIRRRGAFGPNSAKENGFSLVELMVVIFIIGLSSAFVILSLPGGGSETREQAEMLAARIAASRDRAILNSQPVAVWVSASGYGFEHKLSGKWEPLSSKPFQTHDWPGSVSLPDAANTATRIIFDATGLPSSQAQIALQHADGSQTQVYLSAVGEVRVGK